VRGWWASSAVVCCRGDDANSVQRVNKQFTVTETALVSLQPKV